MTEDLQGPALASSFLDTSGVEDNSGHGNLANNNSETHAQLNLEAESSDAGVTIHQIVYHASSQEEVVRILDWDVDPNASEVGADILFPEEILSAMEHIPDAVCYTKFPI